MSIVRIRKPKSGWEIIPNEFINDFRLSVDAVAVGLWLACKPESWQVRPLAIQTEFSRRPGKPRGEEWWTRVSKELRGAGYLRLVNTRNTGRFTTTWEFCVFGLESDKVTDPGSAGVGSAAPGQPPHSNQHEKQPILKLKTPPLPAPIGAAGIAPATAGGGGIFDCLIIEPSINQLLPQLLDILRHAGIEAPAHAQDLLDELAGTIDAVKRGEREKKIDNPVLWMKKVAAGDFIRNRCFEVQARRQASKASQKPALKAVLAFNPLAQAKGEEVLAGVRRRLQSKQIPHRDQI
jgi:hypothetical protein